MSSLKLLGFATCASLVLSLGACSSSTVTPNNGDAGNGGGDTGTGADTGPGAANLTGTCLPFSGGTKGIPGVTVAAGGKTTTTDDAGAFAFALPVNSPYSIVFSSTNTATFTEQEAFLTGDYARVPIKLIDNGTIDLLKGALTGFDGTLGVLSIVILPNGTSCADEGGATIAISPAGTSKINYFSGGLPSNGTSVTKGAVPSAIVYNVQPNVNLTVTLTHPTCTEDGFPHVDKNVTYTGNVQASPAGNAAPYALSFTRLFLK